RMPNPATLKDSIFYFEILQELNKNQGNYEYALKYEKQSNNLSDDIISNEKGNALIQIEHQVQIEHETQHNKSSYYILTLVVILTFFCIYAFIINSRKHKMEAEYNKIISHVETLANSNDKKRKAYYEQQASIRKFFDSIMYAAPQKSSSIKSDLRKVTISDEQWQRLCSSLDVMLDGFVTELSEKYGCSENEVRLFCISYCGGSNNMAELCLPYRKQTIANLKQKIAHKVLGEKSTWNELIESIS
ncbi:MAG: hypothetical protein J6S96_06315, partial [Muribaculaceae bacterium]|nr:hypothetical protein [Muribaculaceae bacterium]